MTDMPFSAPLDFEFYNIDQQPNLLLTDEPEGQQMTLSLTNTSAEQIGYVETDEHHFELVFRPGTLVTPDNIHVNTSGYAMVNAPVTHPDGTLSIFIKSEQLRTWNTKEEITLSGLKAEAGIGTRSTRMMLRYQNLKHAAGDFTGHLETQIHIVNSIGRINIPLQAGFVGDNHVLNDGSTENTLTLRLTNPLRLQKAIRGGDRARLVLVIAAGPKEEEWTLGTSSQVDGIRIHTLDNTGVRTTIFHAIPGVLDLPAYDAEIKHNERSIEFRTLEPGAFMDIEVSNIITGHPTGHTSLILHYENIPGYRDGQFVLVVEKSPILIDQNNDVVIGNLHTTSNVGIGTDVPVGRLQIVHREEASDGRTLILGNLSGSNLRMGYHQDYSWIQSHGNKPLAINARGKNVGIGTAAPGGTLHVSSDRYGDCKLILEADTNDSNENNNPYLIFKQDGGQEESAVYMESNRLALANSVVNGGIIFKTGGQSPYTNASERMKITSEGKVGIGTDQPYGKLQIVYIEEDSHGGALIVGPTQGVSLRMGYDQQYAWIQSHGNKPLAINALGKNVGIGTDDPQKQLHVGNPFNDAQPGIRLSGKAHTFSLRPNWDIVIGGDSFFFQDLQFRFSSALRGSIDAQTGSYNTPSDRSLKENIKPLGPVLDKVRQLEPRTYTWKENPNKERKDEMMGFIAQEVEALFPEIVKEKRGKKSLAYSDFGVLAIGAIKEQQETIDMLNKKVETQQQTLEQLMERLAVLEGKFD